MSAIERPADEYNAKPGVTTAYIGVGGVDAARVSAIHLKWDGVLVGTITLEESNFPDVALNSTVAGDWIAVAGSTASPATSASGAMFNVADRGARKFRIKAVISTDGVLRIRSHGKH
jgi:hypothetical protein